MTHANDFRDLCGAVTSNLDPISSPNETFEAHCVEGAMGDTRSKPATPILLSSPRLPWSPVLPGSGNEAGYG